MSTKSGQDQAAAPLPSTAGTLRVVSSNVYEEDAQDSCGGFDAAAVVKIRLDASTELATYRDVATLTVLVDGDEWLQLDPRSVRESDYSFELYASCNDEGTLETGAHQIDVRASLVGSGLVLDPVRTQVMVTCDDRNGDDPAVAGVGGCAVGSRDESTPAMPLVAFGLVVLASGMRRRR